ncbi:putative 5'-AMP-activated protein kinase, regulatory beta subunit [Monocercomonoides exilis]|uniref:putative 5'-AMP-activated protein kinase, regulatory beta subunit n=1 Tax=Monocercomonoides exilis TaxID=2049356 RepID=UPI0035596E01|nr:putative 5'-AMP-activated protein kinase, regulatory beta subunit [Monocercomonoides exilis]
MSLSIIWFLQPSGSEYAIAFDPMTSAYIESQFIQKDNPPSSAPTLQIEQYPRLIDAKDVRPDSPTEMEFLLDFNSMRVIQKENPEITHMLIRINSDGIPSSHYVHCFEWRHEGTKVYLRGSFDRWLSSIPLQRHGDHFEITLLLKRESFEYKYIVDGVWMYRMDLPTKIDPHGNVNNFVGLGDEK